LSSWLRRSVFPGRIWGRRPRSCLPMSTGPRPTPGRELGAVVGVYDPRVTPPGEDLLFEKAHNFGRRARGYGEPFHPPGE
jgi:hypothetical protein